MKFESDIFGRALLDWTLGSTTPEVLEREDGFTQIGAGPEVYLSSPGEWPSAERQAMKLIRGRVIDVGCGAARLGVHLQNRGFDVTGMDSSPLAVRAAARRGLEQVWCLPIKDLATRISEFNSVVLFGNNFGILETPNRARQILTALSKASAPSTRLFVESTNPYCGGAPGIDRSLYRRNKLSGEWPGQVRLRFTYQDLRGPWFRWLYASRRDMTFVVRSTGWRVERILGSAPSEPYVAVLTND